MKGVECDRKEQSGRLLHMHGRDLKTCTKHIKEMDLRDRYEVGSSGPQKVRAEEDDPINLPVSFMGK